MTATPTPQPIKAAPRGRGTVRMSVTLPEHVARKISEASFAQGRSMSNLISYLLERATETFNPEA